MGSLQLGLPRVVQIWANQLAELDPVPAEKLDVLLRVCGGSSGNEGEWVHQQMLLLCWLTAACKASWLCSWQRQVVSATRLSVDQHGHENFEYTSNLLCLQERHYKGRCRCRASCKSPRARFVAKATAIPHKTQLWIHVTQVLVRSTPIAHAAC
jgi:hypothetical protein